MGKSLSKVAGLLSFTEVVSLPISILDVGTSGPVGGKLVCSGEVHRAGSEAGDGLAGGGLLRFGEFFFWPSG